MNANPKFMAASAAVDAAAVRPLPNSTRIYVAGSRPDMRVPMREISQSDTPVAGGASVERNPPVWVYDTSGPYSDPDVQIDLRKGLAPMRASWIASRADTGQLAGPSSAHGRERLLELLGGADRGAGAFGHDRVDRRRQAVLQQRGHAAVRVVPERELLAVRQQAEDAALTGGHRQPPRSGRRGRDWLSP